jgi:extracellular matrix regulatory protein B
MYIHIGEDILVKAKDIITILDKDSVNSSTMIEEFLKRREETTMNLAKGAFKSIVVTLDKVYLSPLASGTLKKRSSHLTIKDL